MPSKPNPYEPPREGKPCPYCGHVMELGELVGELEWQPDGEKLFMGFFPTGHHIHSEIYPLPCQARGFRCAYCRVIVLEEAENANADE